VNLEAAMPYALFSNAVQISKPFATKADVWSYAQANGLVVEVRSYEEDPPRRILDMGCTIREVVQGATDLVGDGLDAARAGNLAQLMAKRAINPRSATAVS
jgi:hypothetical protein